jgi:hypothetical protein
MVDVQRHVSCPVPGISVGVSTMSPSAFGMIEVDVTTPVASVMTTPDT